MRKVYLGEASEKTDTHFIENESNHSCPDLQTKIDSEHHRH